MSSKNLNRRQLLTRSTASLGGILFAGPVAFAQLPADLVTYITHVVIQHVPQAVAHSDAVRDFANNLVNKPTNGLEAAGFVQAEWKKTDRSALDRYIVVQFMLSPTYLLIAS
jgi:hypothetical protein